MIRIGSQRYSKKKTHQIFTENWCRNSVSVVIFGWMSAQYFSEMQLLYLPVL